MPILGSSASPKGVPSAPTSVSATAGNAQAVVSFTAPSFSKLPVSTYTVTSSPGGFTASGASSPITVTGLSNGTSYTFTVTASHAGGTSAASSASNSVTPVLPVYSLSQTFNSSGTFTVPAGKTKIAVVMRGSGQAGAAGLAGNNGGIGGKGGGGVAFKEHSTTAGSTFSVTIGSNTSFGSLASTSANSTTSNVAGAIIRNAANGGAGGNKTYVIESSPGNGNAGSPGGAPNGSLDLATTGITARNLSGGGGGGGGAGGNAGFCTTNTGGNGGAGNTGGAAGGKGGGATYDCDVIHFGTAGTAGSTSNSTGGGGGGGGGGGSSYPFNTANGGAAGNGATGVIEVYAI